MGILVCHRWNTIFLYLGEKIFANYVLLDNILEIFMKEEEKIHKYSQEEKKKVRI